MKKLILLCVTVIGLALSFAAIADMATDQDKARVDQDRRVLDQDRDRMRDLNADIQRHRQKLEQDQRQLEYDMKREREHHPVAPQTTPANVTTTH